ncbi:MAG: TerB family tellurite resistance protein [Polyangiaceae bacterium]
MGNDTTELSLSSMEIPRLEACVELMFFTAYADGKIDPEERAVFEEHVKRATNGQLGPELIRAVLEHFEGAVRVADRGERVKAIAERLAEERVRRAALVLATNVATADGALTDDERAFLTQVGAAFDLAPDDVARVLGG